MNKEIFDWICSTNCHQSEKELQSFEKRQKENQGKNESFERYSKYWEKE